MDMLTLSLITLTELTSVLRAASVTKTMSSVIVMTAVAATVSQALRLKLLTPYRHMRTNVTHWRRLRLLCANCLLVIFLPFAILLPITSLCLVAGNLAVFERYDAALEPVDDLD